MTDAAASDLTGRVLQVNVSPGGVPKLPVAEAWVDEMGLAGDRHHDDTEHGGPHRAVALFSIEAIRRVAAEGHPIAPGTAGENLTVEGIEMAGLPVGTRLAIGERLLLELSKPDNPCKTIAGSFRDGRFNRLSIAAHALDSRMYARVLRQGPVRPGDVIRVLPPDPASTARVHELLDLIDSVERSESLHLWRGAREAGHDVHLLDDGELAAAASRSLPGPLFGRALGLRQLPNLLGRLLDFYRRHDAIGWLVAAADDPPWLGAVGDRPRTVVVAPPGDIAEATPPAGLTVRVLRSDEVETWCDVVLADWDGEPGLARAVRDAERAAAAVHEHILFGAELEGQLVGAARLHLRRGVALLGSATVLPPLRGRGVHHALIEARARYAAARESRWLAAIPAAGSSAERNLEAMGLRRVWSRADYRFDPADPDGPGVSEAGLIEERMA